MEPSRVMLDDEPVDSLLREVTDMSPVDGTWSDVRGTANAEATVHFVSWSRDGTLSVKERHLEASHGLRL